MNNFDISTTGESIEFYCSYDYSLAESYYEDFLADAVRLEFGRNSAVYLLGDAGQPYYKKAELQKMSKLAIYDLCNTYNLLGWRVSLNDYLKSDYINDLLKVTAEQHYQEAINDASWHNFHDKVNHDYFISTGYSQGDSVYVISLDKPLTKDMREYINHTLWDSPIRMCATINGQDFYEDAFLDDIYTWDIDAVKAKIEALPISTYARGWLADNLPEYPRG